MRLRIGTRGSKLALRQTEILCEVFRRDGIATEVVPLVSVGDRKQGTPAAAHGDKKDWIAGLEEATLRGEVDLVLHSSKDVPLELLEGTRVLPVLEREFPFDTLISRSPLRSVEEIPSGARLGTASLRRQAFLKATRSDLEIVPVRGNITTRLERLDQELNLFGIVLARAGLERLGCIENRSLLTLSEEVMIPAVNQGTLAVQFREDRVEIEQLVRRHVTAETIACWETEREVIRVLEADCRSAVGVFASIEQQQLIVRAAVCSRDGKVVLRRAEQGEVQHSREIGTHLSETLLEAGARELLHGQTAVT